MKDQGPYLQTRSDCVAFLKWYSIENWVQKTFSSFYRNRCIEKIINHSVVKLKLPSSMKIHPTYYVSQLKPVSTSPLSFSDITTCNSCHQALSSSILVSYQFGFSSAWPALPLMPFPAHFRQFPRFAWPAPSNPLLRPDIPPHALSSQPHFHISNKLPFKLPPASQVVFCILSPVVNRL